MIAPTKEFKQLPIEGLEYFYISKSGELYNNRTGFLRTSNGSYLQIHTKDAIYRGSIHNFIAHAHPDYIPPVKTREAKVSVIPDGFKQIPIVGLENYCVSERGEVYNIKRNRCLKVIECKNGNCVLFRERIAGKHIYVKIDLLKQITFNCPTWGNFKSVFSKDKDLWDVYISDKGEVYKAKSKKFLATKRMNRYSDNRVVHVRCGPNKYPYINVTKFVKEVFGVDLEPEKWIIRPSLKRIGKNDEFKPIPIEGYEHYYISKDGAVYNSKKKNFVTSRDPNKGRGKNKRLQVSLCSNKRYIYRYVDELVKMTFGTELPQETPDIFDLTKRQLVKKKKKVAKEKTKEKKKESKYDEDLYRYVCRFLEPERIEDEGVFYRIDAILCPYLERKGYDPLKKVPFLYCTGLAAIAFQMLYTKTIDLENEETIEDQLDYLYETYCNHGLNMESMSLKQQARYVSYRRFNNENRPIEERKSLHRQPWINLHALKGEICHDRNSL